MEKRRIWAPIVVIVAVLLISAGIIIVAPAKDEDSIKIGVLPVIDTLPLYVGQERGLFEDNGVSVELVSFTSAAERDTAFIAGQIDGYFGDMVNTLVLKETTDDVKVVTVVYHTLDEYRMFGLLASPNSGITDVSGIINSPEEYKIATSLGSVSEYFLDEMIEINGMSDKVGKEKVPQIPLRYQSLMNDQIKLAQLPEPFATRAIKEGAKLIADDGPINTTATLIAMKGSFVSSHIDDVRNFLTAYNESVQLVNRDPWQFKDVLEDKIKFPADLADGFTFPPLSDISLPSKDEVDRVQSWMLEKQVLKKEISYESIMGAELYE
ncbi:MAG: ABC transporter substrate-binding protein [Euryarchaeota archaeon]|nr:ABC transporter substrate-binding protein [Euryarchaeota archaeon]